MPTNPPGPRPFDDRLDPALLRLAGIVLLGAVAALLDTTVVSVALDQLGKAFAAPVSTVQWVSTAYLLAMALVIPLTGWCVDRFGARRTWLAVLALFLAGSVLCGAAWSAPSLIIFRVLQGLGAGMILPLTQLILAQAAGAQRFGRVMALVAVPGNLIPIVGPVLGGLLLDGLSWRWIFLINVPVCVPALVLALRALPADPVDGGRRPLDVLGIALLSPAVLALVYGLAQAGERSSFVDAGTTVPVAIGLGLLTAFSVHALRAKAPVVDLRLLRYRSLRASAVLSSLTGAALYGSMLLLPLYYQQARGFDALTTGLVLAPQGIGTAAALPVVGRLADRIGPRPLVVVGALITAAGTVPFALLPTDPNDIVLSASLLLRGIGMAAVGIPAMAAAYHQLPHAAIPQATSIVNVIQRVGAALGTAVVAVILQQQATRDPSGVHPYANTFWWTAGFALLLLPCAALLPALLPARTRIRPSRLDGRRGARGRYGTGGRSTQPRSELGAEDRDRNDDQDGDEPVPRGAQVLGRGYAVAEKEQPASLVPREVGIDAQRLVQPDGVDEWRAGEGDPDAGAHAGPERPAGAGAEQRGDEEGGGRSEDDPECPQESCRRAHRFRKA
ncbi:MDR family MFS transporter [Dactylosporangium sp. NPDC005572]|uniref:MDR family MFS transporter n=1 Tax=Dactylosporangium sp. NPDC005572 TaxID=3156889 RepID=UPI00339E4B06